MVDADQVYNSQEWRDVCTRVLLRDGFRCIVSKLLGGECSPPPLHVHHIVPLADGGAPFDEDNCASVCSRHHPIWEALRRRVVEAREGKPVRCPHKHVHRLAREECEARMRRELAA